VGAADNIAQLTSAAPGIAEDSRDLSSPRNFFDLGLVIDAASACPISSMLPQGQ